MSNLSDAQAALVAANVVLTDVKALSVKMTQLHSMLMAAQSSAGPITPAIMTAKQTNMTDVAALLTDTTAAVAAVQTVVTDLGG